MESKYRIYLFCQEKKYSTILHCYTNYQIAYFVFFDKLLFDYKMAVHCILNLCSTSPTLVKPAINFLWHLHYYMDVKWNLFMIINIGLTPSGLNLSSLSSEVLICYSWYLRFDCGHNDMMTSWILLTQTKWCLSTVDVL